MSDNHSRCDMHTHWLSHNHRMLDRVAGLGRTVSSTRTQIRRRFAFCLLLFSCSLQPGGAEIVLSAQDAKENDDEKPGLKVPPPGGETLPDRFDVLEFLDGDKLRGTFFSIDEKSGVRWRHPAIRQVLEIDTASIGSIKLERPQATNQPPKQTCLVRLTNEDEILGELLAVDATNITLQTWYAGTLTIPRKLARSIVPGQTHSSAIFEGPVGLEGWKQSQSTRFRGGAPNQNTPAGWKYRNGAFYCGGGGSVGRDVKLPETSSLEFELAWTGYLHLGVSFYTEKLENYGGDCYMLQFSSGSIYLQRMTKEGNSSNLGHSEASMLSKRSKASVAIRSNKEEKNISLFINGNLVKQWTDRGEFSTGSGIAFFHQGQGVVRISNLLVTEWDGKLEQETRSEAAAAEDLVKLGNSDQISGELKSIAAGKMQFGTEFATLEVPLDRIAKINLATNLSEIASRQSTDVRAVFANRGSITLHLDRWDDHQVLGHSPNFGQVKFRPSAFTRIDFNLDRQRNDPDLLDLSGFGKDLSAVVNVLQD